MQRPLAALGGTGSLCLLLGACHPPTPQDSYAASKRCYAILDSSLKLVPAARFRQSAVDPDYIETASQEDMQSAFSIGKELGMTPDAVLRDLEQAKSGYLKAHSPQYNFDKLRDDVNECLGDFYGRPND